MNREKVTEARKAECGGDILAWHHEVMPFPTVSVTTGDTSFLLPSLSLDRPLWFGLSNWEHPPFAEILCNTGAC